MRSGFVNYKDVNNKEAYSMQQSYYDHMPPHSSPGRHGPVKAIHDLPVMFPDSDSGFGSGIRSRSRHLSSEDFPSSPPRLRRSASLSRINGYVSDLSSSPASPSHFGFDGSVRSLQESLQDSEHRRGILMNKLKEAQDTLQLQNERLNKIETSAKDNSFIVEDLKCKEREYRRKISNLQKSEEENERLRAENLRLRQEMQDRIDTLDFQLKSLQNQHLHTATENDKRTSLLDQTANAMSLLEEENCKLQMSRDGLEQEMERLKSSIKQKQSKYAPLVEENNCLKNDITRLTEENTILCKKIHEMAGQMVELRNLLHAVKDENESLACNWQNIAEDKNRSSKQVENYKTTISELRSRLHSTTLDKERLFQEKLENNHSIQQLMLDKEELLKHKEVLEEQISEQETQLSKTKTSGTQKYEELRSMENELQAVNKVCGELSTELASVKSYYERAVEQVNMLENSRSMYQQQQQLSEQERQRLQSEIDRLSQMLEGQSRDDKRELDIMEDNYLRLKSEFKQQKVDKSQLEDRNHELEAKLQKANADVKNVTQLQQGEMETWKNSCERLTTSLSRKEDDLQKATDKVHELEDTVTRLREDIRNYNSRCEELSERNEDIERIKSENRRLLQEKAENEQMMKLLETQKDVLSKSSVGGFKNRQDADHLSAKVDQLRNENELLRERILELEKVRDNIIKQKEELLANSELIYKEPGIDVLEDKLETLSSANNRLSQTNALLNKKLEAVDKENSRLKQVIEDGHGEPDMKDELERTRRQHSNLQDEFDQLLQDFNNLEEDNQKLHKDLKEARNNNTSASDKEEMQKLKRERDGYQKQIQLLTGQLKLAEGSKKRTAGEMIKLKKETEELKQNLKISPNKEVELLKEQIEELELELKHAKDVHHTQQETINKMKDEYYGPDCSDNSVKLRESLENVGEELNQMREELHNLMEEIDSKDQTIVYLEKQLNDTREDYQNMKIENEKLGKKMKAITESKDTYSAVPCHTSNNLKEESIVKKSSDSTKLSESLTGEQKGKVNQLTESETVVESPLTKNTWSKSTSSPSLISKTAAPTSEPDQLETKTNEGNQKMQSLIFKYRSYNEPGHLSLKYIRPYVFNPARPSSKSSSLSISSAKTADAKEPPSDQVSKKSPVPLPVSPLKKSPVPPPVSPKPILKKPLVKPELSNETNKSYGHSANLTIDPQEQKDINTLIQKYLKVYD